MIDRFRKFAVICLLGWVYESLMKFSEDGENGLRRRSEDELYPGYLMDSIYFSGNAHVY